VGRGGVVERGDGGGNLTNVQSKATGNCHSESPLYNEYVLIKIKEKKRKVQDFWYPHVKSISV
jgi:hypothetical protein